MEPFVYPIEVAAIVAFAISGILAADQHEMDFVGVFVAAFVTSFGGGTVRDLLLDRHPVYWIEHGALSPLIFGICLVSRIPALRRRLERAPVRIPDAVGLAVFSVAGTLIAREAGVTAFNAILLGTVTGTFGGVLRDVICARVPLLFRAETLYATCAFAGCLVAIALVHLWPEREPLAFVVGAIVVATLRILAIRFDWRLKRAA
ncbi:trimeric intracellular cation channel family protein [soil metagenome]